VFTIDPASHEIAGTEILPAPAHEHGLLPKWLKDREVSVVIAGGMGAHAQTLLKEFEIEVITGAPAESPKALVAQYLAGQMQSIERTCNHTCNH
jgi:predicted Fe-Mo cluster-binding NifX family protein